MSHLYHACVFNFHVYSNSMYQVWLLNLSNYFFKTSSWLCSMAAYMRHKKDQETTYPYLIRPLYVTAVLILKKGDLNRELYFLSLFSLSNFPHICSYKKSYDNWILEYQSMHLIFKMFPRSCSNYQNIIAK